MNKKNSKQPMQSAVSAEMLYNLLNALDTYMFVCDLETDEILFVNDKMKEQFHLSDSALGQCCYSVINTCISERCEFCVKRELLKRRDDTLELVTQVCLQGTHYKKVDRIIEWVGGNKAHLQYFVDISDLMTAEVERKERIESEQKLQLMSDIINSSPQYIAYVDSDGNYDFFNPATHEITGYSHNELMKSGISILYDDDTNSRIKNEIIPAVIANGTYEFEIPLIRKDGEVRIMSFSSFAIEKDKNKHGCIATDITEQKRQKIQLEQTQQSLQTVLDFLPIPITIIDVNEGHLIYANKSTAELFGVASTDDVYGRHVTSFLPELQPDGTDSFEKTLLLDSEKPVSIELMCLKHNGETFDALVTACIIDYKGKQASINIIHDLTAEKEYQDMLRNTAEKEREANRAKSEFLSRMSHEIRTPLNAITGMTTIAKSAKGSKKAQYYLGIIEDASKHLLDLINDILDMSKIESGKLELDSYVINVRRMLTKIENIIRFRTESKEQILTVRIHKDVPDAIMGDELRLTQVITNLLSNANKFTPEGGTITLTVDRQDGQDGMCTLRFAVEDSGIGVAHDQYTRMFSAFEQANSSIYRTYGGTGLGLTISKQLVEMMGGNIWVESELGQGSTFIFTIVTETGTLSSNGEKLEEVLPTATDAFSGQTILLAEDVEINREIISAILEDTGLAIISVNDGLEATETFKSNPCLFNLILMDIQMPEMNGFEATRYIRSLPDEAAKRVPIIAMTANVFKEDIDQCLSAGMNDHIGKPIDVDDLLKKLGKYLC